MNRQELDGLMGMWEMECAIEAMLQMSVAKNVPFSELSVQPQNFGNATTLAGFCQLLAQGWMDLYPYNSYFYVSQKLVERMRQRKCWQSLPDALTLNQRMERIFNNPKGLETATTPAP